MGIFTYLNLRHSVGINSPKYNPLKCITFYIFFITSPNSLRIPHEIIPNLTLLYNKFILILKSFYNS